MLGFEAGTCNGSDLYFQSPSEQARSMLFYMTSCGYYYTDKDYRIDRSRYPDARYLLMYIRSGRLSVTANNRTIIAHRGQLVVLDCTQPHQYHTIDNKAVRVLPARIHHPRAHQSGEAFAQNDGSASESHRK